MRPSRIRLLALGGAAAVVLVGTLVAANVGGGGMPKEEYEQRVQELWARVQEAFEATRVDDPAELDERIAEAQEELRAVAGALEELDPPREVEADNAALAAAMRDYAAELEPLRAAAARGDTDAIDAFSADVAANESVQRLRAAAERMKEKGYDLGPLGRD